jgi:hypothetical protein
MNDTSDPTSASNLGSDPANPVARVAGYRYPTPTGEPCPRTVHVDGTIENNGICQSCGTCLLFGGMVDTDGDDRAGTHA